jgi:PAS domain S-box-containing protein
MAKPQLTPNNPVKLTFEEEQQYHLMIGEVEDYAILMLDPDGVIRNWNKGAAKIKGYTEQEIVGQHFRIFYTKEDRETKLPEQLIDRAAREGKAVHEGWRVRKDGTAFWGSIVITALHDEAGNVVGFSKVTRDLTERKQAEDKLIQNARQLEAQNKELQQFAYAAAHDMKEPLRKIQLYYSAILNEEGEALSARQQQEYMRRSAEAAKRMQILIDDLLAYTQIVGTDEHLVPVDLNATILDVCAQHQETIEQLGVIIESAPLPVVKGTPFQLTQLFANLLSNSLKYRAADRQPRINISASAARMADRANAYGSGQFAVIEFRDNGIGFDQQYSEKIFSLFERLHNRDSYSGTGIGLAICRRIMDNIHGLIRAKGIPDEGATFQIFFRID